MTVPSPPADALDAVVAAARAGDETAFSTLVERHRRELHVHCYRMLGSYDEAEDLVQETFLRAWRARDRFEGGPWFRAWLYRIATNACLDKIRRDARQLRSLRTFAEVPWLQPYPDRLLDEIAATDDPEAVVVGRETIELAFLAALQLLPPRQRAALLVRDVLGWSAAETADLLDTSVAAANSALQRARTTMQAALPARRQDWATPEVRREEREILARFIELHERGDGRAAVLALVTDDVRVTMPPNPFVYEGRAGIATLLERAFDHDTIGEWRLVPTAGNRQPTAASYLRQPGDSVFRAFKFDVLRVVDGAIAEITTFGPGLFPAFGLPPTL